MNKPEKQIHPIVRGMVGFAVTVLVAASLISLIPPAWAAILIPITDRVTINMGELLSWAQFLLGCAGFWLVYRKASEAKTEAADAKVASLQAVKQTDGVLEKVAALAKKEGKAEERTEVAARKETARTEAVADARKDAEIDALKPLLSPADNTSAAGKSPLPVADDRAAIAGERVANATERSAEAQQRVANVAEEKK